MSGGDRLIALAMVIALLPLIAAGMLAVNLMMAIVDTVGDLCAVVGIAVSDDW